MIVRNTVVGNGTKIGKDGATTTVIENSVIGRGCVIGAGVRLNNVYLWDDVVIGDNCSLTKVVLGAGVVIRDYTTVGDGSIVGSGVILGPNATIARDSIVSLTKPDETDEDFDRDDSESDSEAEDDYNTDLLGAEARGHLVELTEDQLEDNEVRYGWTTGATNMIDELNVNDDADGYDDYDDDDEEDEEDMNEDIDPYDEFLEAMIDLVNER